VGLPADNVKAYVWFNLAAAQDVAGATVQRDLLLRALKPEQVLEAQAEARRLSQTTKKPATAR
jgi:TPR repeat protein